jgi:hypothetical protein
MKNSRGQAVLESVLLMTVIFAIWLTVTGILRKDNYFQTIFGTPWERLTNVIEFGIPTADRKSASANHPTSFARHSSIQNE